ncbi:hypothetical protein [Haloarchaeobius sp. DFWS5]|uniref:hypothetical protein n=1 Tax=Haloarchaeobius sp. DFWS5 TaxID=3446114 RepID=UPI003EBDCDB3
MRPPHIALVFVALLLLTPATLPATTAAPPPEAICGVCGESLEDAASDAGVTATVETSELAGQVDENGTATWTARVELNDDAADRFAAEPELRERVVTAALDGRYIVFDDTQNVTSSVDGDTLLVRFDTPDVAHRSVGGVLLFDAFTQDDGRAFVDADRLTVAGPSGTAVTHATDATSTDENRATWTTTGDERMYTSQLDRDATVAFAADGGLVSQAATAAALRAHGLGTVWSELLAYTLVPAAMLGLVAGGLLLAGDRATPGPRFGRRALRWILVGSIAVGALAAVTAGFVDEDIGFITIAVGLGVAPQVFLAAIWLLGVDALGGGSARTTSFAAGLVLAWAIVLPLGAPLTAPLVFVLFTLVFVPFGVLAADSHPARFLFPPVAALSPAVLALTFVPRVGVVFVSPSMFAAWSVASAALGVVLFASGRRLGSSPSRPAARDEDGRPASH